jgi:ATP-dependent RNA helicase DeaD
LEKLQEKTAPAIEKREIPASVTIQDFLNGIVQKLQAENPDTLNHYKKFFTKNVSLFNRSNVAAYLLKLLFEKKTGGLSQRPSRAAGSLPSRQDMKMLFFGLGKNRKVFPRDITRMILTQFPDMDQSDIGDIRILDSYSFVEVAERQAEAIIAALNGSEFRGKTLAVNYGRKKD